MQYPRLAAAGLIVAFNLSCASNPKPTTPAPASGAGVAAAPVAQPAPPPPPTAPPVAAPPAAVPPDGQRGGPPGGPPGGGRGGRPQLTPEQNAAHRDSLSAMRADVIQDLMTRIAGSEAKRSGDVFANVLLMEDTTAAQLLKTMDYYGKSLSVGCQYCHTAGKWDDDAKDNKKTARVMIQLVNLINTQGLSKLPPNRGGQTPKISCVTCHRGRTGPGTALMP